MVAYAAAATILPTIARAIITQCKAEMFVKYLTPLNAIF